MEKKVFKRIGVLTAGGDAPGMNAAVRAVVRSASAKGIEVMGIYGGYRGLLDEDMKLLTPRDVSNIINHGGTMLYSDRCDKFKTEEGIALAVENCKKNGIDGIVTLGGDGTFRGATDLSRSGIGFKSKQALEVGTYYDTKLTIWTKEVIDAVIEIVRCLETEEGYEYGAEFIGMTDTDALKIDIYQIFNEI